ncbi:hypothetical protein LOTGIDRAFT_154035 [Lottia gigantea]|uniref:Uncharacterized protein n=1 Tax=Lottia gigantea TaxID=225164 RepID=V4A6T0_LOTGI|nr:hypothetical protein LOTGIDRAFT_154035 [Lottia gigantea]ESO88966.1 hypothetical protein LOTGIDRAFT_154035 [Lottia gigantea]
MRVRDKPAWITLGGGTLSSLNPYPIVEDVFEVKGSFDINSLPLRDPVCFVSGQIHEQLENWEHIFDQVKFGNVGLDQGEAPHSFRSGCDITMALSGSVNNPEQMIRHIGWFTENSARYYSMINALADSTIIATKYAEEVLLIDVSVIGMAPQRPWSIEANIENWNVLRR